MISPATGAPGRSRTLWAVGVSGALVLCFLAVLTEAHRQEIKPEVRALKALCALNFSSQKTQAQAVCTSQGFVVIQQLLDSDGNPPLKPLRLWD